MPWDINREANVALESLGPFHLIGPVQRLTCLKLFKWSVITQPAAAPTQLLASTTSTNVCLQGKSHRS